MNSIIAYILELNITLTVIYLLYLLVFREDSNFSTRRAFLFVGMLISLVFPFLHISPGNNITSFSAVIISLDEIIIKAGSEELLPYSGFNILKILSYTYLSISLLFLARIIFLFIKVFVHAVKSKRTFISGTKVRISQKLHASSFFNLVFIDPEQLNEKNRDHIIQHEKHHVNLIHSVDRVFAEFLLALSWINPLMWMFRRAVITNHEYQADNRVITFGTDKVSYQLSILNQYIGNTSISNQFSSQIKNRIIMLNKNYRKGSTWKSLLLIPAALILFFFISCNNESKKAESQVENTPKEEQIYYTVEEMPAWVGGGDMLLEIRKYIAQNLTYPQEAIENNVQGRVYVYFLVTKTGDVVIPDPSQLPPEKTESGEIDEVVVVAYKPFNDTDSIPDEKYIQLLKDEGVRVVETIPDLIPGKQDGKAANVVFKIPIVFALQ